MLKEQHRVLRWIIDTMILIYTVSIYLLSASEYHMISNGLAAALVALLLLYVYYTKGYVFLGWYSITFFMFITIGLVSSFWSRSQTYVLSKVMTLSMIFLVTFLLYNYIYREEKTDFFLNVLFFSGVIFSIYIPLHYGITAYFQGLSEGERMGAEIENVNTIGLITSNAFLIGIWLVYFKRKYLYLIPTALCAVIAFGTGSRKVLLCVVIGLLLLFVLKGNSRKKVKSILQCVLLFLALYALLQLPIFTTLRERFESMMNAFTGEGKIDSSTRKRMLLISYGMDYFKEHPFTGIGLGNTMYIGYEAVGEYYYLHNNYVELLASIGIFGTFIYYFMYAVPLFTLLKPVFRQNATAIICFVLLVVELILQYGVVEYYSKSAYFYLMLFYLAAFPKPMQEAAPEPMHIVA